MTLTKVPTTLDVGSTDQVASARLLSTQDTETALGRQHRYRFGTALARALAFAMCFGASALLSATPTLALSATCGPVSLTAGGVSPGSGTPTTTFTFTVTYTNSIGGISVARPGAIPGSHAGHPAEPGGNTRNGVVYSGSLTKPVGTWTYRFRFRTNGTWCETPDRIVHRLAPGHPDPEAHADSHAKADSDATPHAEADAQADPRAEIDAQADRAAPAGRHREASGRADGPSDQPGPPARRRSDPTAAAGSPSDEPQSLRFLEP